MKNINLLALTLATLTGLLFRGSVIAKAESDYIDFNNESISQYSNINLGPDDFPISSGVSLSTYSNSFINFNLNVVSKISLSEDNYYMTISDNENSSFNFIEITNIKVLMKFRLKFNLQTVSDLNIKIKKYSSTDNLGIISINGNSTTNDLVYEFSNAVPENYHSFDQYKNGYCDSIQIRWYNNSSSNALFNSIALDFAKNSDLLFAKTYSGREITQWWKENGYEYDLEDSDYYYVGAEPYYDSDLDTQYLDNMTFVFNQNSQYQLLSTYILHIDFNNEEFSTNTLEKISISFDNRYDGLSLNTSVNNNNGNSGFNFVIPVKRECSLRIVTLYRDSLRNKNIDLSACIKSISIIPYARRNELTGRQFFYFGAIDLDIDTSGSDLYGQGYEDGKNATEENKISEASKEGYTSGFNEGFDAGKKANRNWWNDVEDFFIMIFNSLKRLFSYN